MPWMLEPGVDRLHLVCDEHLDVYEAGRLHRMLVDLAGEPRPVDVDLADCQEVDCAALQLLMAFRRTRAASGLATSVTLGPGRALGLLRRAGVEGALAS